MTDVPLRDHFEARIEALDRRVSELARYHDQAVSDRAASLDARLASMNELRGALTDITNKAATRHDLDGLRDKLSDVKTQAAVLGALASILISLVMIFLARWIR